MLRKFALALCFASLVLFSCLIISCGSSSHSGPKPCTDGPFNVQGDWTGTASNSTGSTTLFGTIDTAGDAVFFDSFADVIVAPTISGACSFSGTLTAFQAGVSGGVSGTASGNVNSTTSISGSETATGTTTNFTLTSYTPLSPLVAVAGNTTASVQGQQLDSLVLTLGGTSSSITFTGTDASSCTFNGTFTEEQTSDVYDVAFNVAGACTPATLTGFGFESSSDLLGLFGNSPAAGTYLYATITSSGAPFVVEVIPVGSAARAVVKRARATGFLDIFGMSRYRAR